MKRSLISEMICPYCLQAFSVTAELLGDSSRIDFGLIRCGCFEFPILNGVLLLNITKGYGGAEEALQPYVAMQVACITFFKKGNLEKFLAWLRRKAPLVYALCGHGNGATYLRFMAKYDSVLRRSISAYVEKERRYEVIGGPRRSVDYPSGLDNWYVSRFLTPRTAFFRDELAQLKVQGPILSLCPGHGIAESILSMITDGQEVCSVDAQLINLLVIKNFVEPGGNFICHDLQYPLPFDDSFFQIAVSSTCLPEIPSHASVIRETVRTTRPEGSILFDVLWAWPQDRVAPTRYYRFCQNEFDSLDTVYALMRKCSSNRSLTVLHVDNGALRYLPHETQIKDMLKRHPRDSISVVIGSRPSERQIPLTSKEKQSLYLNPLYRVVAKSDTEVKCVRVSDRYRDDDGMVPRGSEYLPSETTITRVGFLREGYVDELYRRGLFTSLPMKFGDRMTHYSELQFKSDSPTAAT